MKFHVWLKTVDRRSWLRPEGLLDPTASLRPECKVGTRTLLNDEVPSTHLREGGVASPTATTHILKQRPGHNTEQLRKKVEQTKPNKPNSSTEWAWERQDKIYPE